MNSCKLLVAAILGVTMFASPATTAQEVPVTEENVAKAIAGGVAYLYSVANKDGVWDDMPVPTIEISARSLMSKAPDYRTYDWGGRTALALSALALCGQQSDERFQKALKWLMKQDLRGTYALGLRMQLVHLVGENKEYQAVLREDYKKLIAGSRPDQNWLIWQYMAPPVKYPYFVGDYSNTNYAVLGIWAASDEREEVPRTLWQGIERAWVHGQDKSGGWSYLPVPAYNANTIPEWRQVRGSMTAAGVASLYLIIDNIGNKDQLGEFRSSAAYASLQKGLKWLGDNFDAKNNPGLNALTSYYFYNVERVGAASGMKFIGNHDWFREIATTILAARKPSGEIPLGLADMHGGAFVDTCFSLMFLSTGSASVAMAKLQHDGDWDNRLRDMAILSGWIGRQSERPTNWEVVNLSVDAEDLTDSRILYISGSKPLKFTPEHATKLKRYVELGGLLVFHPDAANNVFGDSVKKLLEDLWPDLKLTPVDMATHPLGKMQYSLKQVHVDQLASPTRVYAFVLRGLPAAAWENRQYVTGIQAFQLGANLHYFATDRAPAKSLPTKLTYFAQPFRDLPPSTSRNVVLARIKHGRKNFDWQSEPLALDRLARMLAIREGVALEVKVVEPADLAASGAKFAYLTGSDELKLTPEQTKAIGTFVQSGGTLIAEQAGGGKINGKKFDASFRGMVDTWFPAGSMGLASSQSPLVQAVGEVVYHNVGPTHLHKAPAQIEIVEQQGRLAIVYSPIDLSSGMLHSPNPMVARMDAESVYRLFRTILLSQPSSCPPPVATPRVTTTQPATATSSSANSSRSTDQLINFTVAFPVNLADYLIPLPRLRSPYLKMHQIAFRPSFQPIFLPSSCDRPT